MNLFSLFLLVCGGIAAVVQAAEEQEAQKKELRGKTALQPPESFKAEQAAIIERVQAMKQQHALHPMFTGDFQLIGSYNVQWGPAYTVNPPTYTCREACAAVFGGTAEYYQGSTTDGYIDNFCYLSDYSFYGSNGCHVNTDIYKNCGTYIGNACESAYVQDWCYAFNYCWRDTSYVPPTNSPSEEPSEAPTEAPSESPTFQETLLFNLPLTSSVPKSVFTWEGERGQQKYYFSPLQILGSGRGFESTGSWEGNLLVWISFEFTYEVTGPQLSLFVHKNTENAIGRIEAQLLKNEITLKFGDSYASVAVPDLFQGHQLYTMALFHNRAYGQTDVSFYEGENYFTKEFGEKQPITKLSIPRTLQHPVKIGLSNVGSDKHLVFYSHFRAKLV